MFGADPAAFASYCSSAITDTTAALTSFGVSLSPDIALRDDDPTIIGYVHATVADLVDDGVIRYEAAEEKWCLSCQLALPPSSAATNCFSCGRLLELRTTHDWFLVVDLTEIFRRAATIDWFPNYGLRRFRSLTDLHPLIRVSHPKPRSTDELVLSARRL